ncbi:MAG TPA: beta-ketoacyl-[acyl-carrier-protein] synthase family protein [Steroidobacteraceae bacterium]|nr:beta-ketoacyl-[acyl-carrier-protein] synthase family protein [Steroidobacteraceae bacterium]
MKAVAVTGVGVVAPIASGARAFWEAMLEGRRAFTRIAASGALSGNCLWARVPDEFLVAHEVAPAALRNADRFTQYAVIATQQALEMSGVEAPAAQTAVILGNTMGGLPSFAETQNTFAAHPQRVTPKLMALVIPNMAAARIALHWGLHGRQLTVSTACASSLDAIGLAARMIESGEIEAAIAGGTETLLAGVVYQSLEHAGALSRASDPSCASRPFDVARDGFVMGDGAAVVYLEHIERARRRGARVLGRIRGYGSLADAYHLTAPEPSGRYEAQVMSAALEDAGCDVQVVFAHATGTVVGDLAELRAINATFAGQVPIVTAPRGHLGHAMAAAGAMSAVAGILGLQTNTVPHTVGTRQVESEAQFDVVLGRPRDVPHEAFCVNAFGFGGQNASLVISR